MDVHYEVNGLVSFRESREGSAMPVPHSHNEIEILLIERGGGTWSMGGKNVSFGPGKLIVFWALRPHRLIKSKLQTVKNCLTVPLAIFQEWELPEELCESLLSGNVLVEPDRKQYQGDRQAFLRWHNDLNSSDARRQKLALTEIQARLGRLAVYFSPQGPSGLVRVSGPDLADQGRFRKVALAADYVGKHFTEAVTVVDVAKNMGMEATAATKMFKKLCGMNLMQYIIQHRLLHAQGLLARTDMKVADIAHAAGYGSSQNFHAAFKEACSMSPQDFRNSVDFRKVPLEKKGGCSAVPVLVSSN
jgi:AraC family transcriptional regulator, melibiose operon regulatory protein